MRRIFTCLFAFGGVLVSAQETVQPLQADRPDQTETPALVPAGMFQMENGFSYEKSDRNYVINAAPSSLIKFGINENFELRLIAEFSSTNAYGSKVSGLDPILIGFKSRLSEEKGIIPKASFIAHLAIPALASKELKGRYYAPEFRFAMQHTLSEKLSFSYNLGAEWDGIIPEATFIYTATLGYSPTGKLGTFIELYGFAPENDRADHRFDCGVTYLITGNFMIDLSGGFGITQHSPDYFLSTGFSFRI